MINIDKQYDNDKQYYNFRVIDWALLICLISALMINCH